MTNETGKAKSHAETSDNKILILSSTVDSVSGNEYSTLVKCDTNGTILWIYRFGNTPYEFSNIEQTPDSGCVFAFTELPAIGNTKDIHLLKVNQNGSEVFSLIIPLPSVYIFGNSTPQVLARNSGDYFLSAIITDTTNAVSFLLISSLDSAGNVQWTNLYDTQRTQLDVPCLDTAANGDLLVASSVIEVPSNNVCYALTRINPNGNLQWSKHFQSNNYDLHVRSIEKIGLDSFYVTGTCRIPFTTYPETCVMLVNGNGAMFWFSRFGFPGLELNTQNTATNSSGGLAFVTYGTDSAAQTGSIAGVVNASGQLLATQFFRWYELASVNYAGNNSYSVVGGGTVPFMHSTYMLLDSQLIACNGTGVTLLTNQIPVSVSTGMGFSSVSLNTLADTLAHSLPGITLVYGCAPDAINESAPTPMILFPNPATEEFTLKEIDTQVSLQIFNAQGELIYAEKISDNTTTVNCSDWKSGVYFVLLISDESVSTQKIIIR